MSVSSENLAQKHVHHFATHHRGTSVVAFNGVLGLTPNGVPVFSNGDEDHFSGLTSNAPNLKLPTNPLVTVAQQHQQQQQFRNYERLGVRWQCVEFARRYMAISKGVWLTSVPTAEDIWNLTHPFSFIHDGSIAPSSTHINGQTSVAPVSGDILVWSRSDETPFGHVAAVTGVSDSGVQIAEQNQGFEEWPENAPYSRELPLTVSADGVVDVTDEDPLLGWIHVDCPFSDFTTDDIPDNFRHILSPGTIVRCCAQPDTSAKWLDPSERCDFFLKRSLMIDGAMGEGSRANVDDVPNGYYVMDYDFWSRVRRAANSLHDIAMEATHRVLSDPDSEAILVQFFGIPKELHAQLRRSLDIIPPMGGRFDFGYDGKRIVMLEYNCDSSAALLECCSTQEKWCKYNSVTMGTSTGSFLRARIVQYFTRLLSNDAVCPQHKLIHFMIDDDDEERYTALCAMGCAEEAGFRCKLCVRLTDFKYASEATSASQPSERCVPSNAAPLAPASEHPRIVDLENEEVLLVWKTWSWDTVLHQYMEQRVKDTITAAAGAAAVAPTTESAADDGSSTGTARTEPVSKKPALADILLNDNVRVLEPLWKTVAGSKAILPFMYQVAPEQSNMVPASFQPTKEIISKHHLSKPVNGRAGQNICMYDPVTDMDTIQNAPDPHTRPHSPLLPKNLSNLSFDVFGAVSVPFSGSVEDSTNESSAGRFLNSQLVYQQRVFLKKFDHKYFPIFCGWMIGNQFSGIVVREDTSKITKLNSRVIPCRVVRSHQDIAAFKLKAEEAYNAANPSKALNSEEATTHAVEDEGPAPTAEEETDGQAALETHQQNEGLEGEM